MFNRDSLFLYMLTGIVVVFVTILCIVFMRNAYKEGVRRGLSKEKMNKVITSSALFSVAPSIAILITVLTLAGLMGMPFPWLRLSVIGAITYEVPAAQNAANAIVENFGTISTASSTAMGFATIAWSMTIGILIGLPFMPYLVPKIRSGMNKIKIKDEKWSKILTDALFLGMISAFLGMAISGITTDRVTSQPIPATAGTKMVSILTFLSSAVLMGICGILVKKCKWKWLEAYAIPICMLTSMCLAILYRAVLPISMFA